jgi:hypothetical protein
MCTDFWIRYSICVEWALLFPSLTFARIFLCNSTIVLWTFHSIYEDLCPYFIGSRLVFASKNFTFCFSFSPPSVSLGNKCQTLKLGSSLSGCPNLGDCSKTIFFSTKLKFQPFLVEICMGATLMTQYCKIYNQSLIRKSL